MIRVGLGLMIFGLTIKVSLRAYKYIRTRQFIDPLRMYPGGFYRNMNRREAQLILGVQQGADSKTIKQRHRILMINNHPDNNGSTYIATKINEAKEMLLNQ